jgi:hypothetical protein
VQGAVAQEDLQVIEAIQQAEVLQLETQQQEQQILEVAVEVLRTKFQHHHKVEALQAVQEQLS